MIAEVLAASGVVVGANLDLPDPGSDEAVVETLAAETSTDPTVVVA